ncbi:THAP domain-containing protein 2-like [Nilaparvata lugens]|uniref:THAP domain-containing protein 2-like n=1 Tax=Nilaparvata lugens TaxID=108931 RepID=UPI00193C92BF|nr:THAP domain-containing protein 2-like [Nilaparvata lugens]
MTIPAALAAGEDYRSIKFPKDRAKWAKVMRRDEWQPKDSDRICSVHFKDNMFDRTGQTMRLMVQYQPYFRHFRLNFKEK